MPSRQDDVSTAELVSDHMYYEERRREYGEDAWLKRPPTAERHVFIATDNCTKIEEFMNCPEYHVNRWTVRSFCVRKPQLHQEELRAVENKPHEDEEEEERRQLIGGATPPQPQHDLQDHAAAAEESRRQEQGTSGNESGLQTAWSSHAPSMPMVQQLQRIQRTAVEADEVVDSVIKGECDLEELENIRWTAEMARNSVWTNPKRGAGADDMYRLWAEVILLVHAKYAIGTFSSNLSRLVQVLRNKPQNTMLSLDTRWKPG